MLCAAAPASGGATEREVRRLKLAAHLSVRKRSLSPAVNRVPNALKVTPDHRDLQALPVLRPPGLTSIRKRIDYDSSFDARRLIS